MKIYSKITALIILSIITIISYANPPKKIGIIIPMAHQAMTEITNGFESTLKNQYSGPIEFKIANVQGDTNLEYATILTLRDQDYDIIVPIGSNATVMTTTLIKNKPIVSLASDLADSERKKLKNCNVAVVHDEVSNEQVLRFIHQVYPTIKNIVLFHSATDKVFPEVADAKKVAAKFNIVITPIMAATLPDLQSLSQNLPAHTQAIFILKDSPIVSGIAQLVKVAEKNHIPLITSDDGSVQNGAGFALGVHEDQIGIEGARLALQILQGKNACDLPITEMNKLTVFLNPKAMSSFNAEINPVKMVAKKMGYPIEEMK